MIVDPDFFDHWRTRMVVDMLGGDQMAPIYIMRLWAHCQNRRADTFDIPTAGLKALCQYGGDAAALESALAAAEYIRRDGATVVIAGWAEKNAQLMAAWANGSKGGRGRKKTQREPMGYPTVTHGQPNGSPTVTQGEPLGSPRAAHEQASREEKRREEEIHSEPVGSDAAASPSPPPVPPPVLPEPPKAPDAKDTVFGVGVPMLVATGIPERNARSFLAVQCKAHGDAAVADALHRCADARPLQPIPWLTAALKPRESRHAGFASKDYTAGITADGHLA